jgi:hypothetical protein
VDANQEVTYHGVEAVLPGVVLAANEGRSYVDSVDLKTGKLLHRLTTVAKPCCVERIPGTSPPRVLIGNLGDNSLQLAEVGDDGKLKDLCLAHYSVPVRYAHRKLLVVATVEEVRLVYEDRLVAPSTHRVSPAAASSTRSRSASAGSSPSSVATPWAIASNWLRDGNGCSSTTNSFSSSTGMFTMGESTTMNVRFCFPCRIYRASACTTSVLCRNR